MYLFSHKDGWSKVEDYPFKEETEDLSGALKNAGYEIQSEYESEQLRVNMEIYTGAKKGSKYMFIASIGIGDFSYFVALPDLPDLLSFLSEFTMI